jgi:hypothetical protein
MPKASVLLSTFYKKQIDGYQQQQQQQMFATYPVLQRVPCSSVK